MNRLSTTTFMLLLAVATPQDWKPFHPEDLNLHQDTIINVEQIDQLARGQSANNQRTSLTHEVVGYLPWWEYTSYPNLDYNLLTQLNYFSAELNQYGDVINNHSWNDLYLVEYAQERGVKVKLCATMFGGDELTGLLSSYNHRQNAINNLLMLVINKGADGIDIDFELLPSSQRENLVLFMQELSEAFHSEMEDPIITMATPAVDWSNAWDYYALAQITDGLFIMGYNYFYSGSETAGPVSPLGGYFYDLDYTVNDYITKTEGQYDKIILGLPYYGYDWPVDDSLIHSQTTGYGAAIIYEDADPMAQLHGYQWDAESHSPWFSYQSNAWHQSWYDDSLSLSTKYQYAIDSELAGVGIWALGYDDGYPELWGAINDKFTSSHLGDINQDNSVNILDVIALVNIILGYEETNELADLNEDSIINIMDVIVLIAIILDN